MQHLRIVGIDEDPENYRLILSDDAGEEFALPVDQALRSAVSRPTPRSARAAAATRAARSGSRSLSPREIQAQLRAGATVSDVVASSGHDAAYVEKYAGPVHAERYYMAQRARSTEIASTSTAEAHRMAFGDRPASLEAMAGARMRSLGIDPGTAEWDAWRTPSGLWQVACWFDMPSGTAEDSAHDLPAQWSFAVASRHLDPLNDWAETLSSLSTADPRRSAARLEAVDAPFDVEEPAGRTRYARGPQALVTPLPSPSSGQSREPHPAAEPPVQPQSPGSRPAEGPSTRSASASAESCGQTRRGRAAPESPEGGEHENLLDVLRARRGQRLGSDTEADDRLALMLTREEKPHTPPRLRALDAEDAPHAQSPGSASETSGAAEDSAPGPSAPAPSSADAGSSDATGRADAESDAAWPAEDEPRDAWGFSYAESSEESEPGPSLSGSAASSSQDPRGHLPEAADAASSVTEADHGSSPHASAPAGTHDAASEDDAEHDAEARHEPVARTDSAADDVQPQEKAPRQKGRAADQAAPGAGAEETARKRGQGRRPSMPKWDDILFGARDD